MESVCEFPLAIGRGSDLDDPHHLLGVRLLRDIGMDDAHLGLIQSFLDVAFGQEYGCSCAIPTEANVDHVFFAGDGDDVYQV